MKIYVVKFLVLLSISISALSAKDAQSPLDIVKLRMSAYNRHDIHAFLSTYFSDVTIYTYPNKQLTQGKDDLRAIFEPMFEEGIVRVTIHTQIEKDSYVVNHETVDYGNSTVDYVSIYRVDNGLITEVRFVRDEALQTDP